MSEPRPPKIESKSPKSTKNDKDTESNKSGSSSGTPTPASPVGLAALVGLTANCAMNLSPGELVFDNYLNQVKSSYEQMFKQYDSSQWSKSESTANGLRIKGNQLFSDGQFDEALAIYNEVSYWILELN